MHNFPYLSYFPVCFPIKSHLFEYKMDLKVPPAPHNYEDELQGLFLFLEPVKAKSSPVSMHQHLLSQLQAAETEKFKLIHDFTVKLRQEERERLNLLSKIADLEGIRMRLEEEMTPDLDMIQGNSSENQLEIDALRLENERLKSELKQKIETFSSLKDSEMKLEMDHFKTQIRILELENTSKNNEISNLEQKCDQIVSENDEMRGKIGNFEREIREIRRLKVEIETENYDLRRKTVDLTEENTAFLEKISEETPNYAILQEKLEETTEKIRDLEEILLQTSVNYEEMRQNVPVQLESRCLKPRNRSKSAKKRSKSRNLHIKAKKSLQKAV